MDLDFNSLESRIEVNEKRLDYENNRYQQIQSKIAYLTIIYSILSIYIVQLFQFLFCDGVPYKFIFVIIVAIYLILAFISVAYAVFLLVPKDVAYSHQPKYFFEEIRDQYIEEGITEDEELDLFVKTSYNMELEEAVESNNNLNNRKSYLYNSAFRFGLLALIPYVFCIAYYFTNNHPDAPAVKIENYKEMLRLQDSLSKCGK
ncbi:MAG: hypothetical protein M3R17_19135 [Bacteroidota bacterium]|nr:hypothetical protein [Bacteroidota bacterium]